MESAAFPGEAVRVWRSKDGKLTDSYLSLKFSDDVESLVAEIVESVYGESLTFNFISTIPSSWYTADMTAENLLKTRGEVDVTIFVSSDVASKESDIEVFRKALQSQGYYLMFDIFYVDQSTLSEITRENYTEYNSYHTEERKKVLAVGHFDMKEDFSFELPISRWED